MWQEEGDSVAKVGSNFDTGELVLNFVVPVLE